MALREPIFADDFSFLQECATTATPKLTIPSPSMVHYRGGRAAIDEDVYPDIDEFWTDLTTAYADEVRRWATSAAPTCSSTTRASPTSTTPSSASTSPSCGGDAEHQHETYIRHINEALAGRPEDMTVTTHMCRGNFRSSWVAEGGYDFVAEALFNELDVDGFFLEYDDARSGGFEPLRFVPKGKFVVLGLVTTKRGELETRRTSSAASRRRRVRRPRPAVPLARSAGSPRRPRATRSPRTQQWAKLRLIVETARSVWG